jgi:hypothetical protein
LRQFIERRTGKNIAHQIKQIPYLSAKLVKEKVLYQKFKDKEFYNDIHT